MMMEIVRKQIYSNEIMLMKNLKVGSTISLVLFEERNINII